MHSMCAQVLKKIHRRIKLHTRTHAHTLTPSSILTHIHIDNRRNQRQVRLDLYSDCPKLCMKERFQEAKRMEGKGRGLVWKQSTSAFWGKELRPSIGVGVEPRVPHGARNRHQCLWGDLRGSSVRARALLGVQGVASLVGLSPSGTQENGARAGAFRAREWVLPKRVGPRGPEVTLHHPPQVFPSSLRILAGVQTHRRTKTPGKKN